jgi:hypothetical protein
LVDEARTLGMGDIVRKGEASAFTKWVPAFEMVIDRE